MKMTSSSLSLRIIRQLSTTTRAPPSSSSSSSISVFEAKSKLRKEYDADKALQIYSSVSDHNISPVSSRYATHFTVQRLAKARRFNDIKILINSQLENPKITQENYICSLIRCYGKAGMFDSAVELYEKMEELGTSRTSLSFNALLAAGNNCGLFDKVRQLFDEMPDIYGCSPDKYSYGILIKAYCEKGEVEMGLNLLKEMEEKGVEVTAVSFTTVLDALYRKGMSDEAERVWTEMEEKGCVIDVATWNVRIGHAHAGAPEGVKALIEEMGVAGLKPDTISFNYLLTCYCRNERMDEAMKVFEELEAGGFRPKAATFRTLIYYLCKNEDYGTGYGMFKKSVSHNKIPDFATLKVLVEGMVKKNMRKDAKGLIRTVKKKFPPNGLHAWKRLEVELGLVSDDNSDDSDIPEAQEATS